MPKLLVIVQSAAEAAQSEGFAEALGAPFDLVLFGEVTEFASSAEKLYVAKPSTSDVAAKAIVQIASGYSHIAAVSSMASKDLLPRIAALLDCAMISDVVAFSGEDTFVRAMYAGSVLSTVKALAQPLVLTFRPSGFPKVEPQGTPTNTTLSIESSSRAKIVENRTSAGSRPDLSQAKLIVSGGRPLKDSETFEKVIGGFADSFGGAVGATRAAVDSGIAPNEAQVGQTGKIVAPDLYIAAGISGSTQHVAGIKDSKLIVAINKDPDAPIFSVADLGIVGDLFDVLPQLQTALQRS